MKIQKNKTNKYIGIVIAAIGFAFSIASKEPLSLIAGLFAFAVGIILWFVNR